MIDTKVNRKNCAGCSACSTICSKNAISLIEDFKGFLYPKVDNDKCIKCGLCLSVCPQLGPKPSDNRPVTQYKVTMKDKEDQLNSQSGGAFYIIAKQWIEEGGVVYGVSNIDPYVVRTTRADNINDLQYLRKSKYVQPINENCFREVINDLKDGKKVLYSGLACHVQGLLNLLDCLKINRTNLCTIDLICHGAPSPKIYKKTIRRIEKKAKITINEVLHRDKRMGWRTHVMTLNAKNKASILCKSFPLLFSKNYLLHNRCFNCRFATKKRYSDITIADFWSGRNFSLNDLKYGISHVLLRNHFLILPEKESVFIKLSDDINDQYNLHYSSKKPMLYCAFNICFLLFGIYGALLFSNPFKRFLKRILKKDNIKF